jgi:hypothetical protein
MGHAAAKLWSCDVLVERATRYAEELDAAFATLIDVKVRARTSVAINTRAFVALKCLRDTD